MTFSGEFFSFKSAWIFACTFQFCRKILSRIFFRLKCYCSSSLCSLCALWYFVFVFLRNNVQTSQKNTGECFSNNLKSTCKIQALLKEKYFIRKSHLHQSCTKPLKLLHWWQWGTNLTLESKPSPPQLSQGISLPDMPVQTYEVSSYQANYKKRYKLRKQQALQTILVFLSFKE